MEETFTINDVMRELRTALFMAQNTDISYDNQVVQIVGKALDDVRNVKNNH